MQADRRTNDLAAEVSLAQDCGVNFVTVKWNADNSPAAMIIPKTGRPPNWSLAFRILSALTSSTPERLVNAWLTRLAIRTAAPKGSEATNEMKMEIYCKDLQDYPADVVQAVLEDLGREKTFFPSWEEIYSRLQPETQWRRCAMRSLQDAMDRQGVAL
jgi:hypothetical protein